MKMEHDVLAESPAAAPPSPAAEAEWQKVCALVDDINRIYPERRSLISLLYLGFLDRFGPHWSALHCLGVLLHQEKDFSKAEWYLNKTLQLNPSAANVWHNLALAIFAQGRFDEALAAFEKALAFKPWYPNGIESMVVHLKLQLCEWDGLDERIAGLRRIFSTAASAAVCPVQESPNPFILIAANGSLKEQQECARRLTREQRRHDLGDAPFVFSGRKTRNGPLRIGYLSSDFYEHATGYLMAALFETHDRQGFEIVAYSNGPDDDSFMRRRLLAAFDKFVDIRGLSDRAAAERIHADGIDILVDLKGHTADSRSTVLGYRPAPLQVQFLGYPGTMGDASVDYLIADPFIVPKRHFPYYDEKIVHLPDCYQPNDPQRQVGAAPTRAEVGLPETGVVYCSFNQTYKITPAMFDIWMRILSAVPGSVLWILESNRWAAENLRREARARGVEGERLVFAPLLAPNAHFGRYQLADVMLDTLPYNAHTTASDALWAGVPVVTCPGETFAARVAGSLLHAMELPELVMPDLKQYEEKAIELGRKPDALAALKAKIRSKRFTSALFDIGKFTHHLESAYERMWKRYVRGEAPEFIAVPRVQSGAVHVGATDRKISVRKTNQAIPKVVHQTYGGALPLEIQQNIDRMRALNPGWEFKIHSDEDMVRFIEQHYPASVSECFQRINPRYGAARADLFRYLLLYQCGGVYFDIKSSATRPLDDVIQADDRYLLCHWPNKKGEPYENWGMHPCFADMPNGEFQNWNIVAAPGHPFLKTVIERVLDNIRNYDPHVHGVGGYGTLTTTTFPYTLAIAPLLQSYEHRIVDSHYKVGFQYSIFQGSEHRKLFKHHYAALDEPIVL